MATLRDIKRRITSVQSTMQITSAMKMVSAAKLNRAQMAARAAQPYSAQLRQMVVSLAAGMAEEDHPLFARREGGKTLVVVFSTDRGLCGGFNSNLNRRLVRFLSRSDEVRDPELLIVGRVANDYFKRREWNISKSVVHASFVEKEAALRETIQESVERFRSGEAGKVYLAYNHFYNPMRQEPTVMPLLPIEPPEEEQEQQTSGDNREAIFEPSRAEILNSLLPRYVEDMARLAQLNTEAGEHGARMVAMESATKNAGDMIDRLTLQYNRLRQAAITKELTEIINGAQSL